MRECFATVLRIAAEVISVEASFFELGGNSLRAVALSRRMTQMFSADIVVADIMQHSTISSLARAFSDSYTVATYLALLNLHHRAQAFLEIGYAHCPINSKACHSQMIPLMTGSIASMTFEL